MSIFDKLFGTSTIVDNAGKAIDKVADTVDKFVLTKQEKFDAEQHEKEMDYRFREYDQENFKTLLAQQLQYYQMDAEDRKDARDYAKAELASEDKFASHFRYWFAAGIIFIILILMGLIIFYPIPQQSKDVILFVLGILSTTFTSIISFYFGSSQGSSLKAKTIDKQLETLNNK